MAEDPTGISAADPAKRSDRQVHRSAIVLAEAAEAAVAAGRDVAGIGSFAGTRSS